MDKSFAKKVISVVLGITLILLIFSTVTLIVDTVLFDDLKYFNRTDFDNLQKFFNSASLFSVSALGVLRKRSVKKYAPRRIADTAI